MLESVKEIALEAFIHGLPDEIARSVDVRDPKDLDEALKYASRIENRMRSRIIPSGEISRVSFAEDSYPSTSRATSPFASSSNYYNTSNHYQNYPVNRREESRSRSPSPSSTRIPQRRPNSPQSRYTNLSPTYPAYPNHPSSPPMNSNHQNHLYYPPYPMYPPMFYPPPYYPPYPMHNPEPYRSSSPANLQTSTSSRPPSPHPNKPDQATGKDSLNFQPTRRTDATTSQISTQRRIIVKKQYLKQ